MRCCLKHESEYLRGLLTTEGKMGHEIDRLASAVLYTLSRSVVVRKELSCKLKLFVYEYLNAPRF